MTPWATRAERPGDVAVIREVNTAAFPTDDEAKLVDALRADTGAWIEGLSTVAVDSEERIVAHALLTRCTVGGKPALALAPCAVLPMFQRTGAGSAAIYAGLDRARGLGENLVVVLGHARYYPRFGFTPASAFGVTAGFDVADESFLALALDPKRPTPTGQITYAAAFEV